jgi:hypothetical protein
MKRLAPPASLLPIAAIAAIATMTFGTACGGVASSAVATGPFAGPPRTGPVAVYMAQPLPAGAREIGLVEARGGGDHDGVDVLFPELVRRAQQLGANAVVIEWLGPRFDVTPYYTGYTTQMVPCGRGPCLGMSTSQPTEIMTVVLRGRAYFVPEGTP